MFKTITTEDVQRYVRIGGYMITGALARKGVEVDGTWMELGLSMAGGAALLAWSVFGMRINGKIAELNKLAKIPETSVAGIIMTNNKEGREMAQLEGPIMVAGTAEARRLAA